MGIAEVIERERERERHTEVKSTKGGVLMHFETIVKNGEVS